VKTLNKILEEAREAEKKQNREIPQVPLFIMYEKYDEAQFRNVARDYIYFKEEYK